MRSVPPSDPPSESPADLDKEGVVSGPKQESQETTADDSSPLPPMSWAEWRRPLVLFVLTCLSTLWVGAQMSGVDPSWSTLWRGWTFALPLMGILLAHEMGHYIAGRIHQVDISPPHFIPLPISLLGTMGAVIRMRGRIRSRDALLDIGAAGPLAGMVVALPVLIYGLATSPVEPLGQSLEGGYIAEGHSLLYKALLYLLKGPIPEGHDIMLSPTALAGWAGLLVTMINMIPFGQLDGGHVAYALWGKGQDRVSRWVVRLLPVLAVVVSLAFWWPSYAAGEPDYLQEGNLYAGVPWLVWWVVLMLMTRYGGSDHPPTDDDTLSPGRRIVAIGTLLMFLALFMPAMVRTFAPA